MNGDEKHGDLLTPSCLGEQCPIPILWVECSSACSLNTVDPGPSESHEQHASVPEVDHSCPMRFTAARSMLSDVEFTSGTFLILEKIVFIEPFHATEVDKRWLAMQDEMTSVVEVGT